MACNTSLGLRTAIAAGFIVAVSTLTGCPAPTIDGAADAAAVAGDTAETSQDNPQSTPTEDPGDGGGNAGGGDAGGGDSGAGADDGANDGGGGVGPGGRLGDLDDILDNVITIDEAGNLTGRVSDKQLSFIRTQSIAGGSTSENHSLTLCRAGSFQLELTRIRTGSVNPSISEESLSGTWSVVGPNGAVDLVLKVEVSSNPAAPGTRRLRASVDATGALLLDDARVTLTNAAANCASANDVTVLPGGEFAR